MQKRTIILAALLLVMAGGAYYLANSWIRSQKTSLTTTTPNAPPPKTTTHVLVAAKSLPAGEFVTKGSIRWQSWPDRDVPTNYIVRRGGASTDAAVAGSVVRVGIAAGQPLTREILVKPGDRGFLATALWPGMRAVSVPINRVSGLAGLVFPGDRVDLILTVRFKVKNASGKEIIRRTSETVLEDVRVIAIDQRMDHVPGKAKPQVGKTATLELTPKQVEVVMVALDMGALSLSLRSLSTNSAADRYIASSGGNRRAPPPAGRADLPVLPHLDTSGVRRTAATDTPIKSKVPTMLLRHKVPTAGTTITRDTDASKVFRQQKGNAPTAVIVVRGGKAERVPVK